MAGASADPARSLSVSGDPEAGAQPLGERVELGRSMNGQHYWRIIIPGVAEEALERAIAIDAQLHARYDEEPA